MTTPPITGEDRRGLTTAAAGVQVRAEGDGAQRFAGHAAVFDSRAEIGDPRTWGFVEEIAPGAFTRTLAEADARFLIDHDSRLVVSRVSADTLGLAQDRRGLAVDSALDTRLSYVTDLVTNIDNRNVTGMSFGFRVVRDVWTTEDERGGTQIEVRRLLELDLVEVSAVTFPAYEDTDVGVRGNRPPDDVRAVGLALRSRPDAAAQFEARSWACPELGAYFARDAVRIDRPGPAQQQETHVQNRTRNAGRVAEVRDRKLRTALRDGRSDWYRIERREAVSTGSPSIAEILIYDVIGGWFGVEADDLVRDLASLDVDEIIVRINSPGGSVFDAIAILNALRGHRAKVTTVVDALAASAASVIAMAGDEIVMWRNSEMMIHDPWGICVGDAEEMRELAGQLDHIAVNIATAYLDRAGGTVESWRALMLAETWFSAEEAVAAGLADRVRMPNQADDPIADVVGEDDEPDEDDLEEDEDDEEDEPEEDPEEEDPLMRRRHDLTRFTYPGRRAAPDPAVRVPDRRAQLRSRRMQVLAARLGG